MRADNRTDSEVGLTLITLHRFNYIHVVSRAVATFTRMMMSAFWESLVAEVVKRRVYCGRRCNEDDALHMCSGGNVSSSLTTSAID